jgi:hypothetical protein
MIIATSAAEQAHVGLAAFISQAAAADAVCILRHRRQNHDEEGNVSTQVSSEAEEDGQPEQLEARLSLRALRGADASLLPPSATAAAEGERGMRCVPVHLSRPMLPT